MRMKKIKIVLIIIAFQVVYQPLIGSLLTRGARQLIGTGGKQLQLSKDPVLKEKVCRTVNAAIKADTKKFLNLSNMQLTEPVESESLQAEQDLKTFGLPSLSVNKTPIKTLDLPFFSPNPAYASDTDAAGGMSVETAKTLLEICVPSTAVSTSANLEEESLKNISPLQELLPAIQEDEVETLSKQQALAQLEARQQENEALEQEKILALESTVANENELLQRLDDARKVIENVQDTQVINAQQQKQAQIDLAQAEQKEADAQENYLKKQEEAFEAQKNLEQKIAQEKSAQNNVIAKEEQIKAIKAQIEQAEQQEALQKKQALEAQKDRQLQELKTLNEQLQSATQQQKKLVQDFEEIQKSFQQAESSIEKITKEKGDAAKQLSQAVQEEAALQKNLDATNKEIATVNEAIKKAETEMRKEQQEMLTSIGKKNQLPTFDVVESKNPLFENGAKNSSSADPAIAKEIAQVPAKSIQRDEPLSDTPKRLAPQDSKEPRGVQESKKIKSEPLPTLTGVAKTAVIVPPASGLVADEPLLIKQSSTQLRPARQRIKEVPGGKKAMQTTVLTSKKNAIQPAADQIAKQLQVPDASEPIEKVSDNILESVPKNMVPSNNVPLLESAPEVMPVTATLDNKPELGDDERSFEPEAPKDLVVSSPPSASLVKTATAPASSITQVSPPRAPTTKANASTASSKRSIQVTTMAPSRFSSMPGSSEVRTTTPSPVDSIPSNNGATPQPSRPALNQPIYSPTSYNAYPPLETPDYYTVRDNQYPNPTEPSFNDSPTPLPSIAAQPAPFLSIGESMYQPNLPSDMARSWDQNRGDASFFGQEKSGAMHTSANNGEGFTAPQKTGLVLPAKKELASPQKKLLPKKQTAKRSRTSPAVRYAIALGLCMSLFLGMAKFVWPRLRRML